MAYTAINFVPAYLGKLVNFNAHGFYIGEVVQLNGASWTAALADDVFDAQSVGIVSQVIDANNFVLTQVGWISGIASPPNPLVPGDLYYLSDSTPGLLSTSPGEIVLPLLYADTITSGYFMNSYPQATSGTFTWNTVTTNTQMAVNNGYLCNNLAGPINMTLPVNFAVGDKIVVTCINAGGFIVAQNGGQSMIFGNDNTSIGILGGLETETPQGDSLTLVGSMANTEMVVTNSVGNFIVT